ncbi:MAG: hypothetical protein ACJ73N_16590 [Bryobacteraceae bacterium]
MAVHSLARVAVQPLPRATRDGPRLALKGVSPVLDREDSRGSPGRPAVPKDIRELIRTMSRENPLSGVAATGMHRSAKAEPEAQIPAPG